MLKELISTVVTSENEFHSKVDSTFSSSSRKAPDCPSAFAAHVNTSVTNATEILRTILDCDPLFLVDEEMDIDKCREVTGNIHLSPKT